MKNEMESKLNSDKGVVEKVPQIAETSDRKDILIEKNQKIK